MPHNVQKDPESSHAWILKDEIVRRSRAYYGKLTRGKTMFIAPRMIPHFNAIWGVAKREEKKQLSAEALAVLKVLRKEWEMATADLRNESGVKDRKAFTRAIDDLQAAMIVVPSDVVYQQVQLHLDAGRRAVSRTTGAEDRSQNCAPRDRAMLSGLRRHDLSGRIGQSHRTVSSRSRRRESGARQRRDRNGAFHRVLHQIEPCEAR